MEEIQLMKKLFTVFAVLAVVAFCVSGMVAEEAHHPHIALVKHAQPGVHSLAAQTAPLGIWVPFADFAAFSNATNSDGTFLWPCFGAYEPSSGTFTGNPANPDCPTIGDPSVPFPSGGIVLGNADYLWTVADCNATATSSPDCADQESMVSDNTQDITDDVWVSIVITQGTTTIYNTGTEVYGPDIFGQTVADYPLIWIDYNPQNLGDMGIATGPNNGNCLADFQYPLTSPAFAPPYYIIAAGKTCGAATTGPATVTFTVEYGTPKYTKSTKAATCGSVPTPCYTVKFTKVYEASSKFTIYLY